MIKTLEKQLLVLLMLFFIAIPNLAVAQDPLDDGPDPPPAPIDDHINLMMIVMFIFLFGFFYYREYRKND
jgi:hypothetical protein